MTNNQALDDIILYLNANEPKGLYCENIEVIKNDLDRLEKLEKVFSDLKSMFEINIGIDCGNEYFIEIKQLDSRISELIPQEDIKIFKEVLENGNG